MIKPDDISQEIWNMAVACYNGMPMVYDGWDETAVCECIARALTAAKAEEREACAIIAETASTLIASTPRFAGKIIAASIRNLSQDYIEAAKKAREGLK